MSYFDKKISHGILWSAVDVTFRQGIQFIILVILARLLSPEDFGLISLLGLFVGLANVLVDGGFSSALIQRQHTSITDESTIFFFNLFMGLFISLTLCVIAPYIATFFKDPLMTPLIYAMAFNVQINAFGSIHTALLTKNLNFKLIAKIGGLASAISGILAILAATQGLGVWSLVIQTVTASCLSTSLFWLWHPWRPKWIFSLNSLKTFFRFGGYLMTVSLIHTLHMNLYSFLIGKFYNLTDVGYYDRAQRTNMLPVDFLMLIINRVAFSSFSSFSTDKKRLANAFRKSQRLVMFLNIPLSVSIIILAEPIILILYGEKWIQSAPILQVLGLVGLMWPMHMLNINVLQAQGRSDLFFRITMIKKAISISLTIVSSFYGIIAIAWAHVIASLFNLVINTHYSQQLLEHGVLEQVRDLLPSMKAAILMAASMWLVKNFFFANNLVLLVCTLTIGWITYFVAAFWLKHNALQEALTILQNTLRSNEARASN